ncbi:MAG: glycosyltransferase, partial [Propionibacteriaceae bacterium]|nr:glycosyltransferase [Propionibacteriaceae bacterium]
MSFDYQVSVIVPAYNAEDWLGGCLNSLIGQSVAEGEMEIIVVDDGSSDSTERVAMDYAALFDYIHCYRREHGGPGAARNTGITQARGKYLMFVDADDILSSNTVELCVKFFDGHADDIELLVYHCREYRGTRPSPPHWRYKSLLKTGVYDITDLPYAMPTEVSFCVKNRRGDTALFSEIPGFYEENQDYCARLLKKQPQFGYVAEAEYRWQRANDQSLSAVATSAVMLF